MPLTPAPAAGHDAKAPQTLRASCGSISRLVRDAATGAVVQQLGVAGALAARGGGYDDSVLIDGFEPPHVGVLGDCWPATADACSIFSLSGLGNELLCINSYHLLVLIYELINRVMIGSWHGLPLPSARAFFRPAL